MPRPRVRNSIATAARFGVSSTLIPPADVEALRGAIRPETRLVIAEAPTNPYQTIPDLEQVAAICRERRVKTLIDSTFATPINFKPAAYGIDIVAELKGHDSLDKYNKWHWAAWAGAQYLLFKSGPITSNVVEGGAFWFADKGQQIPDLQFHFLAGAGAEAGVPSVPPGSSGITLNSYTLRPKAPGTVRLRSADPAALPIVDPNFLGHPDDLKTSVEGVKISREIFSQASLQKHIRKTRFPDDEERSHWRGEKVESVPRFLPAGE